MSLELILDLSRMNKHYNTCARRIDRVDRRISSYLVLRREVLNF